MNDEKSVERSLRKADFWTSIVLFALGVAMFIGATTFPMTDSYGGVQNVWYVSPALFPLIIATALVILSLVLFANAIVTVGVRDAVADIGRLSYRLSERDVRLVMVIALIGAYVYALVPRVDFFLATALFLQAFIGSFYPERSDMMKVHAAPFLAFSVLVGVLALVGPTREPETLFAGVIDAAALGLFVIVAFVALRRLAGPTQPDRRRVRIGLVVSVVVPLILCPVFKYLLLVPLPMEGLVTGAMDSLRYALRTLTG
jgi:hypothetical protein